jgi:uncharacterized RDD family membrane protein YckC
MTITALDTRTEIETPENVTLVFDLAGPGARMGAYLIDFIIRVLVGWALSWVVLLVFPILGVDLPLGVFLVGWFLLEWGYGALFEGLWRGRTPGKKYFRLRVIKDVGTPINFYDAAIRNLLRAADILPIGYGVGLICMTATRQLQRIGDLVAGTIVVREDQHRFERRTDEFDRLDPIPPGECSGRFRVSERTLDVVEQLLWRRQSLPRRRVEEIAEVLAVPVARQLGYDLEDDVGVSRNVYFLRRVLRTFSTIDENVRR